MASRRSATSGAAQMPLPDLGLLQEALREGVCLAAADEPTPLHRAAAHLEDLGFLAQTPQQYVWCRNEQDPDYRFTREDCRARIDLRPDLDEEDGDYRCPDCGREVWPSRKQRFMETVLRRNDEAITAWLGEQLQGLGQVQTPEPGVWRLMTEKAFVHVVLIEACADQSECFGETWALANPVLYVAIDPDWASRHALDWLRPVGIASFIGSETALREALAQVPDRQGKTWVAEDTRIYSSGRPPVRFEADHAPVKGRLFQLTLWDDQLLINGEVMLNRQAKGQLAALRVLIKAHLNGLASLVSADECTWLTLDEIAGAMEQEAGSGGSGRASG